MIVFYNYYQVILLSFLPYIIDTSSTDQTITIASNHNAKVITIPQSDFNHVATREYVRKQLNTDIIVYLTQDDIPMWKIEC